MVRPDRLKDEIFGGVGWRQPTLTGSPVLNAANLESKSGLVFQDGVFFVTLQNLKETQEDPAISDDDFNTYLENLQKSVILETCQKIEAEETDFVQSANIYPYEKSFINTIEPNGKFVGFQMENFKQTDILNKINWVELTFDSAVTFDIHLYNSNLPKSPIKTESITTVANESVVVTVDDWELADNSNFKGGTFYWGYFEDDLAGAKALRKDFELSDLSVTTRHNFILPVAIDHTGLTIDVTTVDTKSDTFGLNFNIDTYHDWTEKFIRNKSLLYQPILYQMAEKVFDQISFSNESNRIERITKGFLERMAFAIYGNPGRGLTGINGKLTISIENVKNSMFYKPRISVGTLE